MADTHTFEPSVQSSHRANKITQINSGSKVLIVGAGAFGVFTALALQKNKINVTLVDAWGPGNSRSSSGDETRVIRSTYGANEFYFDLNVRALELWKEYEIQFPSKSFFNTGVLWFCYDEKTPLVDQSVPFSRKHQMEYVYLSKSEMLKKYPEIHCDDLHHAYFDPYGGYLKARESCANALDLFIRNGGTYLNAYVSPGEIKSDRMENVLINENKKSFDLTLFACGSWLGKLFPDVLGERIQCTRQEVYYFGTPSEKVKAFDDFPVWVDVDGADFYYGIPGNAHRGFKIGVDKRGEAFDPTHGERTYNSDVLQLARNFINHRFPSFKNAPLLESRVCPYETTPDGNFIFDVHPAAGNVVFLGGGSGHGFKHSPALGELVSDVLTGKKKSPDLFSLNRFQS